MHLRSGALPSRIQPAHPPPIQRVYGYLDLRGTHAEQRVAKFNLIVDPVSLRRKGARLRHNRVHHLAYGNEHAQLFGPDLGSDIPGLHCLWQGFAAALECLGCNFGGGIVERGPQPHP